MSEPILLKHAKKGNGTDFRCAQCDKLLAKTGVVVPGFEIKCIRCGQLNLIFDDANELLFFTDKDGVILFANDYVETLTGYTPDEVVGKTPRVWGGQMSPDFYEDLWRRILERREAVAVQVTNKHKDGTLFQALLRISPILDEAGGVQVFFGRQRLISDNDSQL